MNTHGPHPDDNGLPKVSNAFRDDLRAVFTPISGVPTEIDTRIAAEARNRLILSRRWRWLTVAASVTAAAAAIALVVTLNRPEHPIPRSAESVAPPLVLSDPHDIDGNGRVDVLDAFLLAKQIERSRDVGDQYDVTADGRIDREDVEAVVFAVVRIDRGSFQ